MKIILSDILNLQDTKDYVVFRYSQPVKPCVGCFGCWIKTPGKCIIKDSDSDFAIKMPYTKEVIVISELVFGGLSPNVKAVFDRSIGFILPFFRNINGEMHHVPRYKKRPNLRYMFYASTITEAEKITAQKLIKANAINFGAEQYTVDFYSSHKELLEDLK